HAEFHIAKNTATYSRVVPFRAASERRRWLVERQDGRRIECSITVVQSAVTGEFAYERCVLFGDAPFDTQAFATRADAERNADERLREFVRAGWVESVTA